jgi:hypothetical protein
MAAKLFAALAVRLEFPMLDVRPGMAAHTQVFGSIG